MMVVMEREGVIRDGCGVVRREERRREEKK